MNDLINALLAPAAAQLNDLAHSQPMAFILAPCAAFLLLAIRGVLRR